MADHDRIDLATVVGPAAREALKRAVDGHCSPAALRVLLGVFAFTLAWSRLEDNVRVVTLADAVGMSGPTGAQQAGRYLSELARAGAIIYRPGLGRGGAPGYIALPNPAQSVQGFSGKRCTDRAENGSEPCTNGARNAGNAADFVRNPADFAPSAELYREKQQLQQGAEAPKLDQVDAELERVVERRIVADAARAAGGRRIHSPDGYRRSMPARLRGQWADRINAWVCDHPDGWVHGQLADHLEAATGRPASPQPDAYVDQAECATCGRRGGYGFLPAPHDQPEAGARPCPDCHPTGRRASA